MPTTDARTRMSALALLFAGVLFLLYPVTRPWHDESTVAGATEAFTANAWIASHSFAMLGFILVALGLLGIYRLVSRTRAEPTALAAVLIFWAGAGLTLAYYGAETFGLRALGQAAADGQAIDLLEGAEAVRFQPVAVTAFGLGLLGIAAGAVLAAVAVARSRELPRGPAALTAIGFALFLPQFFTPPAVRIGHGVLLAIGLVWLGAALWRAAGRR